MDERQTQILLALRQITEEVAAQHTLNKAIDLLVQRIRAVTSADCCSLYLSDPFKKYLRLAATDGLEKAAVGKTNLQIGEGLVGYVGQKQELLDLADAPSHPNFKYLPDIGEDEFFSFLGVPVINQGELQGVLVIQSKKKQCFDELEESFMVTLSAQIASIIATSKNLRDSSEANIKRCRGESGTGGIAIAKAIVWQPTLSLDDVPITCTEDRDMQLELFNQAIFQLQTEMDQATLEMQEQHNVQAANGYLSGYGNMLDDPTFQDEVTAEILDNGLLASSAIKVVTEKRLQKYKLSGLKEKYFDARDFAQIIISRLVHTSAQSVKVDHEKIILVVKNLPAAMVAELDRNNIAGFITVDNTTSSHTAILARDLGIPAVISVQLNLNEIDGRTVIIDGHNSEVLIEPSQSVIDEYRQLISQNREQADLFSAEKNKKAVTLDNVELKIQLNAGLSHNEADDLAAQTDGIGLYRTEIAFMISQTFPSEMQQTEWYRGLLKQFKGYPVCMRTLDIGGDKGLSYLPIEEGNPALGWRGIRVTLDQPNILKTQLRSMLLAQQEFGNLEIMIPMVSRLEEVISFKKILNEALKEIVVQTNKPVKPPRFGVMIEVPSIAYVLPEIAKEADFFSIGSNDLIQYLMAVDRSNQKVCRFFDAFNPAVIRCLKYLCDESHKLGKPISVCGEIAGDPLGSIMLLSLGYKCLSMNYSELARVKYICRRVSFADLQKIGQIALTLDNSAKIRSLYREYAANQGLNRIIDMDDLRLANK